MSGGMLMSMAWGGICREVVNVQRGEGYVQGWVCLEVEACPGGIGVGYVQEVGMSRDWVYHGTWDTHHWYSVVQYCL